ncbi:YsnF/AvaK domain-containing protein [Anabaena sp. CCY 0017]|uniref:YsnF/AvaK domain-containing protein n=1 Tax=Anabaena sp. CCY 0017 TaxID=3103866 RepID=UPI0039C61872
MNSQPMVKQFKEVTHQASINALLENLRNKVRNFYVTDPQGQIVGKVKDLILDANRRINLVISQQENPKVLTNETSNVDCQRLVLLLSKKISKIDNCTKSILLDIDKSEIELMPEYLEPETQDGQGIVDEWNELNTNTKILPSEIETANATKVDEENIVRLIEERLIADSRTRKLGEVIVRKEIETRMVQVPVRREKLIVEQVGAENKQLAEIDLSQGDISGIELMAEERPEGTIIDGHLTVGGNFTSPKIASLLLNAIALEQNHGCHQVKITIAVKDESLQQKYQEWFDRCSKGQKPKV